MREIQVNQNAHAVFNAIEMAIASLVNHAPDLKQREALIGDLAKYKRRAFYLEPDLGSEANLVYRELMVLKCLEKMQTHSLLVSAIGAIYQEVFRDDIANIKAHIDAVQSSLDAHRNRPPENFNRLSVDILAHVIIRATPLMRIGVWRELSFYFYALFKEKKVFQDLFERYLTKTRAYREKDVWHKFQASLSIQVALGSVVQIETQDDMDYVLECFARGKHTSLCFEGQHFSSDLMYSLLNRLKNNTRLVSLNLTSCPIYRRNSNVLIRFLFSATNLINLKLNLRGQNNSPSFIDQVLFTLSESFTELLSLELCSDVPPSPESGIFIAKILNNNPRLSSIVIVGCQSINCGFAQNRDIQEAILRRLPYLMYTIIPGLSGPLHNPRVKYKEGEEWLRAWSELDAREPRPLEEMIKYLKERGVELAPRLPENLKREREFEGRIRTHFSEQRIVIPVNQGVITVEKASSAEHGPANREKAVSAAVEKASSAKTEAVDQAERSPKEFYIEAVRHYIDERALALYKEADNLHQACMKIGQFLQEYFARLPLDYELYFEILNHLKKDFYGFLGRGTVDSTTPWNILIKQIKMQLLQFVKTGPHPRSIASENDRRLREIFSEPCYVKRFLSRAPELDDSELKHYEKAISDCKIAIIAGPKCSC